MTSALAVTLLAGLIVAPLAAAAVDPPPGYGVGRTEAPASALLAAHPDAWAPARAIEWGPSPYTTQFRALWSNGGLHLLWEVADPRPWHTMTKRDDPLWKEEVVEVFLDLDASGTHYYELEINPAGVVCDLEMISPSPWKGDFGWDFEGLETRVHPRTDATGATTGWAATAFLPWSGFRSLPSAQGISLPPKAGDEWRFNVFRIKRPSGPEDPKTDAVLAAWSLPSAANFHEPAAFRPFRFEDR